MAILSRELRRQFETTIVEARRAAEEGARKSLEQLAVHHYEPWATMTGEQRTLRNRLRAHGRQLGDKLDEKRDTQTIDRLTQECAYEHWHRMLFARFLAESQLLIEPDSGMAISLNECRELAREKNVDWLQLASQYAVTMLPQIFRTGDPVLELCLPPETRQQLEELLKSLPADVFTADDSLGWVYQFWQTERKDRVNKSETKIGADELAAVTQLFTEDYMVLFLLHNTLGAWWAGKALAAKPEIASNAKDEDELRAECSVGGYEWTYLRFVREGEKGPWRPAAGTFDGWPRAARDLKILDPCMGSGHFLVFALPILAAFRMEEERLPSEQAVDAVLRDNLFGLELDNRCTQIAAFNLALTAWRIVGVRPLPQLNIACSGLGINAKEEDWMHLAGKDERCRETMRRLYHLFQQAPALGSLIDPKRVGGSLFTMAFEKVRPLLQKALSEEHIDESETELAVTAQGLVKAAAVLTDEFTLVATNVPYLGRGNHADVLKGHFDRYHPMAKADLATCFVERTLGLIPRGGTVGLVVAQNWLFLGRYKSLRQWALRTHEWDAVARLGPRAFETISGEIVSVALTVLSRTSPSNSQSFAALDVSSNSSPTDKADGLRQLDLMLKSQLSQISNPDSRIVLGDMEEGVGTLSDYVESYQGAVTGDLERFTAFMWEVGATGWEPFRTAIETADHDNGLMCAIRWEGGNGQLAEYAKIARKQLHDMHESGQRAWGEVGIAINRMTDLLCTRYTGMKFDNNVAVLIPRSGEYSLPVLAFCSSEHFPRAVRALDQTLKVTNQTLRKVPFDLSRWQAVALDLWPAGFPAMPCTDPTQWIFEGKPNLSNHPLQVAVARLLGFRWPRQTGSNFVDYPALDPDSLEKHLEAEGIVCLNPVKSQLPAADRLRALLSDAFGQEWSGGKQAQILANVGYKGLTLEDWLRDGFFEQHCEIFHHRPFIWHIWDGLRRGFHALVNYHKLAAPGGEGRRTFEKLIYAYLGDWIQQQRYAQDQGLEGADARVAAAEHLKTELEKILEGEPPYDIFVRWKPLHEQPIGWEPDLNDGVRINIRSFMMATTLNGRGKSSCILRVTPKIRWDKDRGKEPHRQKDQFPWFWGWDEFDQPDFAGGKEFDGNRWNDLHYSRAFKQAARARARKGAK